MISNIIPTFNIDILKQPQYIEKLIEEMELKNYRNFDILKK